MLVVVEDGNIEFLLEPALDFKAAGSGDVLEVDAAEAGSYHLYGSDDLVRILGVKADGEGVDTAEFLEEDAFALHDGHGRIGADVSETEDSGAVRDDGNRVLLDGIGVGSGGIPCNDAAGGGNTGSVGQG